MLHHSETLLLQAAGGWGNRILPLVSAMRAADLTNRKLIISWRTNEKWLDIPFHEIWANTDLTVNDAYKPTPDFIDLNSKTSKDTWVLCVPPTGNVTARSFKGLALTTEYDEHQFYHIAYPEWFKESLRTYYKKLVLTKKLQDTVDELSSKFDSNTLGVHLRKKWLYGRAAAAPDKWVYEQVEKYDKFFLTSDSRPTEYRFKKRYGDRVIIQHKTEPPMTWDYKSNDPYLCSHGSCSDQAIIEAVIDWATLINTKSMIAANWSSFSLTAACFGNIPVKIYDLNQEPVSHSKYDYSLGNDC